MKTKKNVRLNIESAEGGVMVTVGDHRTVGQQVAPHVFTRWCTLNKFLKEQLLEVESDGTGATDETD